MGGVVGHFDPHGSSQDCVRGLMAGMGSALMHRGPDDSGVFSTRR
jgi:asparagine synthetase B (glutamine-hydrolysing)